MIDARPLCHLCPLNGQARLRSMYTGAGGVTLLNPPVSRVRLVIISEPPSQADLHARGPLETPSHKYLRDGLRASNIGAEEIAVIPATLCYGANDKLIDRAARCCAPRVLGEIAKLRLAQVGSGEMVTLTLGKWALRTLTGYSNLLNARGFSWRVPGAAWKARRKLLQDLGLVAPVRVTKRVLKPKSAKKLATIEIESRTQEGLSACAGLRVYPILGPENITRQEPWRAVDDWDLARFYAYLTGGWPVESNPSFKVPHEVGGPDLLAGLGPEISLDIETDGLAALSCRILCVGVSDGKRSVVLWPWVDTWAPALSDFLATRAKVWAHNGFNFDQIVLRARGVDTDRAHWDDTLLAYHAYQSHLPQRLDWVASTHLTIPPWKVKHGRRGGGKNKGRVDTLGSIELAEYNAEDCYYTMHSARVMSTQPEFQREAHTYEHDRALATVCKGMIEAGVGIDYQRKGELSRGLASRERDIIGECRERIRALGFAELDPEAYSPTKPVENVKLFKHLGAPLVSTTSTGKFSVDDLALEKYAISKDERIRAFASLIQEYRATRKTRSTYVGRADESEKALKFDSFIEASTRRAHFNWKPFGTVSGRLSCRMQSFPRPNKTHLYTRAREIIVPAPGCRFVYFDVSQAEMRLAAYLSGDPVFMRACDSQDLHAANARLVFPEIAAKGWLEGEALKDSERGKPYRDIAKNFGFAIGYGAGPQKLVDTLQSKGLPVTLAACQKILKQLRALYKVYFAWADQNVQFVRANGWMRSPFLGRIRHFGRWVSPTEVFNYPIQSALADLVNERTISICKSIGSERLQSRIVAQIHDADIFETGEDACARVQQIITSSWAAPINTRGGMLVLPIDLKGKMRWSEL